MPAETVCERAQSTFLVCSNDPLANGKKRSRGQDRQARLSHVEKNRYVLQGDDQPRGWKKRDLIIIFAFGNCNGHCTICWMKPHSLGNCKMQCSHFPLCSQERERTRDCMLEKEASSNIN